MCFLFCCCTKRCCFVLSEDINYLFGIESNHPTDSRRRSNQNFSVVRVKPLGAVGVFIIRRGIEIRPLVFEGQKGGAGLAFHPGHVTQAELHIYLCNRVQPSGGPK